MQPPSYFDPSTSVYVTYSYNFAVQWVNPDMVNTAGLPTAWSLYTLAVYNLAADTLINITQDQPGDPIYTPPFGIENPSGMQYWAWLRKQFNVLEFIPGIVSTTSDEGTSVGYIVPESFSQFTISNLQNLKTNFGRTYLGIVQSWGKSAWGIS